jgi:hypothetical protein
MNTWGYRAGAALMIVSLSVGLGHWSMSRAAAAQPHTPAAHSAALQAAPLRVASRRALPAGLVAALRHRAKSAQSSGTTWTQQAEFSGIGGQSVAISGTTAVAGAPGANNYAGAVDVFVYNGGTWTQQATITAADGVANDRFGTSVAFNGTTLAIGAPGHNHTGAVYVFVHSSGTWTQQAELTAPYTRGRGVGYSLALSGSTILAGTQPGTGAPVWRSCLYSMAPPGSRSRS